MMLYTFIKKDGNAIRIGADCTVPEALQQVMLPYSEAGYELAEASEHDLQVIGGAMKKPEEPVSVPVEEV